MLLLIISRVDSLGKFQRKHFEITMLGIIPFHYMPHLAMQCQAMSLFTCHVLIPLVVVMSRNWTNSLWGSLDTHTSIHRREIHVCQEARFLWIRFQLLEIQIPAQVGRINQIIVKVIGNKIFIISSICQLLEIRYCWRIN